MSYPRKKLIEVALPLEEINAASVKEKSIRQGHPSTMHLWWARRPLAACRAVLFASIVDDPSSQPDKFPTIEEQEAERNRLFGIIRRMVPWDSSSDPKVLIDVRNEIRRACTPACPAPTTDFELINEVGHRFNGYEWIKGHPNFLQDGGEVAALQRLFDGLQRHYRESGKWKGTHTELRASLFYMLRNIRHGGEYLGDDSTEYEEARSLYNEIRRRWDEVEAQLPVFLDPFCGGGSIPLEAQRLGLEAYGSDLNPVAVLITKALIEFPQKFAGRGPVNSSESKKAINGGWKGAEGLAADLRYYGHRMRVEAKKRIGHLYPPVKLASGEETTVIAWIWTRTVKCPNPACGVQMPVCRSWTLSSKTGKAVWVEPRYLHSANGTDVVKFEVRMGEEVPAVYSSGTVNRLGVTCICCGTHSSVSYLREEGRAGRIGERLMAIVAEGKRERVFISPTDEQEEIASIEKPASAPTAAMPSNPRWFSPPQYGMEHFDDIFTNRQLVALTTFSDLVGEIQKEIEVDAIAAGLTDDKVTLDKGGLGAQAYSEILATYLAFAVSKAADRNSELCSWEPQVNRMGHTFQRQAVPMTWDFAETNPLAGAGGDIEGCVESVAKNIDRVVEGQRGSVVQRDATKSIPLRPIISTDPPYYDNIGYADLSDYFYIWLRRALHSIYPELLATLLTPKTPELVATPYRFRGDRKKAEEFFETGLGQAFEQMRAAAHPDYPLTVYYAFKQAESQDSAGVASTGWETMLEGLIRGGFQITGTWPMRSELANRMIARNSNALASSIVLVCRQRPSTALTITRPQFLRELRRELPGAIRAMQHGNVAPVDFAQASIGPGMSIFSRYEQVQELDGSPLRVRTALGLINQSLDEVLSEQEGDYDSYTRWAVTWFEQNGMSEATYGSAETLATAKVTSVSGLVDAGIITAKAGKVRLLLRSELASDWHPANDKRLTVWETCQHLIRALDNEGEIGAGRLLSTLQTANYGEFADKARDLAYRLYSTCERKKWAQEAISYNSLVIAWPNIADQASTIEGPPQQTALSF